MASTPARLAVLLSGRGSNFVALAEACETGELPARIALVLSNTEGAAGLEVARERGLAVAVVPHVDRSRMDHEQEVLEKLRGAEVDWVCLAGYMRILSRRFVEAFPERILNIHPSLLPSFPGLQVHEQALDYGVKVSGCTVHLVDARLDSGPIVLQRTVEVREHDTPGDLANRVLEQEHRAYKEALRRLLVDHWTVKGHRIVFAKS